MWCAGPTGAIVHYQEIGIGLGIAPRHPEIFPGVREAGGKLAVQVYSHMIKTSVPCRHLLDPALIVRTLPVEYALQFGRLIN